MKAKERISQHTQRFQKMPLNRKIIAGLVAVLAILIILEGITFVSLTYLGITGDDLVLYVKEDVATLEATRDSTTQVKYTTGVKNLLFCTAKCAWDITDMSSGAVLSGGTLIMKSGAEKHVSATFRAPNERSRNPVQMRITCQNTPSRYCKSAGDTHMAGAVTQITTTYTRKEQVIAEEIEKEMPSWLASANGQYKQLIALNNIASSLPERFLDLQKMAMEDLENLQTRLSNLKEAGEQDNILQVSKIIATPPTTRSLSLYLKERSAEEDIRKRTEKLSEKNPEILEKYFFAEELPSQQLLEAVSQYNIAVQDSKSSLNSISGLMESIENIEQSLTIPANAKEWFQEGKTHLFTEQTMICKTKGGSCPAASEEDMSVERFQDLCQEISNLESAYAIAYESYLFSLMPNETNITIIENALNIPSIRSNESWNEWETEILAKARNGTEILASQNIVGALHLQSASETRNFFTTKCPQNRPPLPQIKKYETILPNIEPANVSDVVFAFSPTMCCINNQCHACFAKEQPYPILFVHGHAFISSTAPEQSLEAFSAMSFALQKEGMPYIGRVFPGSQYDASTENQFAGFGVPLTAHGTYYYDAYQESGETTWVIHKSESIETYSIRLQESIQALKQRTGSEKVIIVAHSMGGLVSRRYLQIFGDSDVATFVMIGTPNQGISGKTLSLCPWFGAEKECTDMTKGSVFMKKLNGGVKPSIPTYVIAGKGCDDEGDGVVPTDDVLLSWSENFVVEGECPSTSELLHNTMLNPDTHPEVYSIVKKIITDHNERK